MPVLKILLNQDGEVIGSAQADAAAFGSGGPQFATMVAGEGQRIVEVTVDEADSNLDPEALHDAIKARLLR
jgi:hypothetical protein